MKKIIICLTVLLLSLSMFGCHGQRACKEFEVPENFDETKDYEITFWFKHDTNKRQVSVYTQAKEEFEKLYPNIKVTIKPYTDYNAIYNDVITNISTKTTPNVCISYPDHIATYLTGNNVMVALDDLMNDSKYGLGGSELKYKGVTKEEIVPEFLDECILNGSYYLLPYMRSTEALYINKTYVEKLGYSIPDNITWDFIFEVSEKALEKNEDGTYKVNDQNVMIPFIYKSTDNMMIQLIEQNGSPYSSDNGDILIFNEETKKLLEMIQPYAQSKAFSTFKISSYPGNYINAGQCIFGIDSTAGSTWMGNGAPNQDIAKENLLDFELVVKEIPQLNDNKKMISQGPSLCLFNSDDPQEVLASWLFMQYLLTYAVQFSYSNTEGYLPVTKQVIESPEFINYLNSAGIDEEHYAPKIEAKKILLNNLDNTFVTPVFNGSASLRTAAGQLIEEVCKSSLRKETIDDNYYTSLFEKMNSLYRLDQKSMVNNTNSSTELPTSSKTLLITLAVAWSGIIIYFVIDKVKKNK